MRSISRRPWPPGGLDQVSHIAPPSSLFDYLLLPIYARAMPYNLLGSPWRCRGLLLLLLLPLSLSGQAKYAGELFEFPGDARSVGMGGSGVSSTHEAATGFYNPALVGQLHQPSLTLAHREQFGGVVSADLAAISFKRSSDLAVHLGLVRRGVDDIPDTRFALDDRDGDGELDDDERLIADSIRYFNQREWGILLSVARKNQTGWCWGASAKLIGQWLAGELGLGMGFDLGLWRAFGQSLSLGVMLQDITTTQIHWSTGRWETTAPRLTTGFRWAFSLPLIRRAVAIEGELTSRLDGRRLERFVDLGPVSVMASLGFELALTENLRLRAGSATLYPFTLGAGLRFRPFSLDYAYIGDTQAGIFEPTHQLSINLFLETLRTFLETE
ncbi:MAG: hypothetical protein JSU77_11535 [Fidelibacterota bacterium]|nr:MAG: hypothetical protein JSU77_11535 [Candidatus Neomarinimicrobiota bacterium]